MSALLISLCCNVSALSVFVNGDWLGFRQQRNRRAYEAPTDGVGERNVSDESGRKYIDRNRYVPHFLALIANVFTSGSSREYLARYGVGLNEARIVSVLGHVPGLTPTQLSAAMGMNKSIVSRSLAALVDQGFLEQTGTPRALKNLLTPAGYALHDHVVFMALRREERLLEGFSTDERALLLDFLVRMLRNTETMRFPNS